MKITVAVLFIILLAIINATILTTTVYAKDLGVIGDTYPITEMDFMMFIHSRLIELQQTGQWRSIEKDMQQRAAHYRDRPKPVSGISNTTNPKSWIFDPSIVLDKNIYTPNGKLIALAGMRINPLSHVQLLKSLIFFDGDDANQCKWVALQIKRLKGRVKLILVNGSLLAQETNFNQPVYFDQSGKLTNRFGIQHVPAMVVQDGLGLRISEIKP